MYPATGHLRASRNLLIYHHIYLSIIIIYRNLDLISETPRRRPTYIIYHIYLILILSQFIIITISIYHISYIFYIYDISISLYHTTPTPPAPPGDVPPRPPACRAPAALRGPLGGDGQRRRGRALSASKARGAWPSQEPRPFYNASLDTYFGWKICDILCNFPSKIGVEQALGGNVYIVNIVQFYDV